MKVFLQNIMRVMLEAEAKLVLRKYKPKIIAVIGTVGKTGAKDAIFSVTKEALVADKSKKSFDNEAGLGGSILGHDKGAPTFFFYVRNLIRGLVLLATREHYPKWLVLDIGADKPGNISRIAKWLHPEIVIFTSFSPVPTHIEFFESAEGLLEEKAIFVKALKSSGVLILNADDEQVLSMQARTKATSITYGFSERAMFRASNMNIVYEDNKPTGVTFKFEYEGNVFPVTMPGVLGIQPVYSALSALSLGVYLKLNIVEMINALSGHDSAPGRMRILTGIKGATVIDDSSNSSPISALSALQALSSIKTIGRKITVLGDMLELGKFTIEEHRKIGIIVGQESDILVAVGPRAKYIVEGALESGMKKKNIIEFDNSLSAGKYLEGIIKKDDIVLVNGSASMRLENVVKEIMWNQEDASRLLVRQGE
ncbi:MAG: UDP-N-acetylmuramoyl-tripeptide--D-alanyl-D-alanine ligase [Candidatus Pacebacteria bacterium]|nr:UDP-N-acetylmuramoyl-tripeptide--D-alanyl-D-alanine ligase [Candidatus Paceibacterota bacterium]